MNDTFETIELALPVNAAYVSAARLTASSIANRMSFGIEEIEDIKAAVSEACTFLIRQQTRIKSGTFRITFVLKDNELHITLTADMKNAGVTIEADDYGIMMLKALMDGVEVNNSEKNLLVLLMQKKKVFNNSFEV